MGKKCRDRAQTTAATDHRLSYLHRCGGEAFVDGKISQAIVLYTEALNLKVYNPKIKMDILSNRGTAYVRVRDFSRAMADFKQAIHLENMAMGLPLLKTLNRLAKLEWLAQDDLDRLTTTLRHYMEQAQKANKDPKYIKELLSLIKKTEALAHENLHGMFNMEMLMQRREQTYDCAEFVGPIRVENLGAKGRGIVAEQMIKQGHVVLAQKAFAIAFPPSPRPDSAANDKSAGGDGDGPQNVTVTAAGGDHPKQSAVDAKGDSNKLDDNSSKPKELNNQQTLYLKLVDIIVDMVDANPSLKTSLFHLCGGVISDEERKERYPNVKPGSLDDDRIRIGRIVHYGATFSASNPNPRVRKNISPVEIDDRLTTNTYGLWTFLTYINHSCIDANVDIQKFGDFMIVRASKNIMEGEEILTSYNFPNSFQHAYESELGAPEDVDFNCSCRLCLFRASESEMKLEKRRAIVSDSWEAYRKGEDLEEYWIKLEALCPAYSDINFYTFWISHEVALQNKPLGMFRKAIWYFEKAYNHAVCAGLARQRVRIAVEIFLCYIKVQDFMSATQWSGWLKDDFYMAYGNYSEAILRTFLKLENMVLDEESILKIIAYTAEAEAGVMPSLALECQQLVESGGLEE